jgi:hypothetical protein
VSGTGRGFGIAPLKKHKRCEAYFQDMIEHRNLTADEIFFIFKEEHRLCSPLDPEADPSFDLQPTSTIDGWREARDLLTWDKLAEIYNEEYRIEIPLETWKTVFEPGDKRSVKDVCELMSKHAQIEVIKPIKILGQECISSAIFKSIKKNLDLRGIDTSSLSPSSKIEPVLKRNFGEFLGLINKNFTGVIPEMNERRTTLGKLAGYFGLTLILSLFGSVFWDAFLIVATLTLLPTIILLYLSIRQFKTQDEMLTIPGIVTFRDLVERIVELKYASQQNVCSMVR